MNPLTWDAPWLVVAGALFVIVMARANGTYWVGRALAAGARRSRGATLLEGPGYLRAERWIDRWGAPVVAVSFLTVGVQTLVNLAAGATRMRLVHYLPAVTVGCLIWAAVYATVGFVGWRAFTVLYDRSPTLAWAVTALALAALVAFVVLRWRREKRT